MHIKNANEMNIIFKLNYNNCFLLMTAKIIVFNITIIKITKITIFAMITIVES